MSAVGLVDSLYLSWVKISHNQALCVPGLGDCWTVNNSEYSELYGIPVAFLGAASFLVILVWLLLEDRQVASSNFSILAVFGISFFGVLFSAYLTYIELFIINAICPFCVLSAITMLAIFILTTVRLLKSEL